MKKIVAASICIVAFLATVFCIVVEARHHDPMEPQPMPCYNCGGYGTCPSCGGSGEILIERWDYDYPVQEVVICNECDGSGQCQVCFGTGTL